MSRAAEVMGGVFADVFRPPSQEEVWRWASKNVYLDERMAAKPGHYDPELTPWTKWFQDVIRDPEVREVFVMKDSQSGFTEAALNVIRWMPENMPGNVLFCINSREKAKKVSKLRLGPTIRQVAAGQMTDDGDDFSTYSILLNNMEITVSGSGSVGAFAETWYRVAVLDECELHEEEDGTTTIDKVTSRFRTVEDGLLLAMSKPELEGGVIHQGFLRGTQEEWEVPCPRCGEYQPVEFEWLRFGHCKDLAGGWDLERVQRETWLECRHCNGRIEEGEKRWMNERGRVDARMETDRMRAPNGKAVQAEPGVRSFHCSALMSMFPNVTWGDIARRWLMAFVVAPSESGQRTVVNNDFGLPAKVERAQVTGEAVRNLCGGLVEEVDGKRQVLGKRFGLVYVQEEVGRSSLVGELPIVPHALTIAADRQASPVRYPYLVYAWDANWQSYLVDMGDVPDVEAFLELRSRPYPVPGREEPAFIQGGFVDCGDQKLEVCRMCLRAQEVGWDLHPTRGQGFTPGARANISARRDNVDGRDFWIYDFYDHALTGDFMLGVVGRRREPRLWLPSPAPERVVKEWTATKLVSKKVSGRVIQRWECDRKRDGANDLMDCAKQQLLVPWLLAAGEDD